MAPSPPAVDGRQPPYPSHDSPPSASTTDLGPRQEAEKSPESTSTPDTRASPHPPLPPHKLEQGDDDSLDETGPFLGQPGVPLEREPRNQHPHHRRRMLDYVVGGFLIVTFLLVIRNVFGGRSSETSYSPDADHQGPAKAITMDQIHGGFWRPASQSISWIADPEGRDGLLLEQGAPGKDFLVVEDVRSSKGGDNASVAGDAHGLAPSRTLMQKPQFEYRGRSLTPDWLEPSPDLKKVLVAVDRKKNWRHSFTATYFVLDVASAAVEPLVPDKAAARIQLATWSPASDTISFTMDNNLYVRILTGHADVVQITTDGGPDYFYGVPDWVYEEEIFSDRTATWWSESSKYLAFLRTNETTVREFPVEYHLSRPSGTEPPAGEEAYPEVRQIKYPKPGSPNPVVDLQFFDVGRRQVFSVAVADDFAGDDRIISNVLWAGHKVLVKHTNRVGDHLKLVLVDAARRSAETIKDVDVAAVDGGWHEVSHTMAYVPADPAKGRRHDGYVDTVIHGDFEHLAYFSPLNSSRPVMLTSGSWEVEEAPSAVDLNNNLVYFVATRESSIQRHVYSVKLDGSNLRPMTDTSSDGYYAVSFSTRAGFALLSYQGPGIPYQKVVSTPSAPAHYDRTVEDNAALAKSAREHDLPVVRYGTLDLGGGFAINYKEQRPPRFDPHREHPVLFQQYSGPNSQSVTKRFGVDFQSYVASALGYVVVTVDPRGTGFLGRRHRVAVRSRLGFLEARDHIAAARHFASLGYVDASRLAIWGWSYGGFATLKTLEQDAGRTFSYGMAVAPVTDWRFYNSIYTERYMRLPTDNAAGYDASRVANASALGRSVRFLLMHGTADDNVHFQNSLHLLDALDLAGVENYDVHVFPDSDHSIAFHNANRIVYDSESPIFFSPPKPFLPSLRHRPPTHQSLSAVLVPA